MIPVSYYDHIPHRFPKTVILRGPGGCSWKVATEIKDDEVLFSQGWPKFVRDNTLNDGDFLTFAYNGAHIFEVSIFRGYDACKEISEVTELEEEEEDSVISLSSEDTDTGAKSEMKNTVPEGRDKGSLLAFFPITCFYVILLVLTFEIFVCRKVKSGSCGGF